MLLYFGIIHVKTIRLIFNANNSSKLLVIFFKNFNNKNYQFLFLDLNKINEKVCDSNSAINIQMRSITPSSISLLNDFGNFSYKNLLVDYSEVQKGTDFNEDERNEYKIQPQLNEDVTVQYNQLAPYFSYDKPKRKNRFGRKVNYFMQFNDQKFSSTNAYKHSLIHSLAHSFTPSLGHSFTPSLSKKSKSIDFILSTSWSSPFTSELIKCISEISYMKKQQFEPNYNLNEEIQKNCFKKPYQNRNQWKQEFSTTTIHRINIGCQSNRHEDVEFKKP